MEKQIVHLPTQSQTNFSSKQSIVAESVYACFSFYHTVVKKNVFKDQDLICIASRPFLSKTACRWQ